MATIFGKNETASETYLPLGSCEWSVGSKIKKSAFKNIVLVSFTLADSEIIDVRRCFNDMTHIFAFGRNSKANLMTVTLLCFVGKKCNSQKNGLSELKDLRDSYEQERIYTKCKGGKTAERIKVSIDELNVEGYLIGLDIGPVNADNGTCQATLTLILAQDGF